MANANQRRDSHGRFKPDHRTRNLAIGAATVVGVGAAAVVGALKAGLLDRFFPAKEGHDAPDLALDADPADPAGTDRAPDAFRPDPTATPTAVEREGLHPPSGIDKGFMADDTRAEPLATVS